MVVLSTAHPIAWGSGARADFVWGATVRFVMLAWLAVTCVVPARIEAGEEEELFEVDKEEYLRQVDARVRNAEESLQNNQLSDARAIAGVVDDRLSRDIISREWRARFRDRIERILLQARNKEDSLVARNIDILKSEGISPALDFKRERLQKCGVSEAKLALVDEAIVRAAAAGEHFEEVEIRQPTPAKSNEPEKKKGILMKNGTFVAGRVVSENANFFVIETEGSQIRILKKLVESIDGVPYDAETATGAVSD